ncbi:hypothetical protein DOFOFD_07050 [Acetobacteraceae bacterium EV16P]|uniref:Uncharacterized protein n=1 Tax=Sorlinia euscelidii TaxID=3081148 RepID=A0ABU7U3W1_9PROT
MTYIIDLFPLCRDMGAFPFIQRLFLAWVYSGARGSTHHFGKRFTHCFGREVGDGRADASICFCPTGNAAEA